MEDLNKRLVEVEYILKKLDDEYIKKIPQEIWDYIEEKKDKNYIENKINEIRNVLEKCLDDSKCYSDVFNEIIDRITVYKENKKKKIKIADEYENFTSSLIRDTSNDLIK